MKTRVILQFVDGNNTTLWCNTSEEAHAVLDILYGGSDVRLGGFFIRLAHLIYANIPEDR